MKKINLIFGLTLFAVLFGFNSANCMDDCKNIRGAGICFISGDHYDAPRYIEKFLNEVDNINSTEISSFDDAINAFKKLEKSCRELIATFYDVRICGPLSEYAIIKDFEDNKGAIVIKSVYEKTKAIVDSLVDKLNYEKRYKLNEKMIIPKDVSPDGNKYLVPSASINEFIGFMSKERPDILGVEERIGQYLINIGNILKQQKRALRKV